MIILLPQAVSEGRTHRPDKSMHDPINIHSSCDTVSLAQFYPGQYIAKGSLLSKEAQHSVVLLQRCWAVSCMIPDDRSFVWDRLLLWQETSTNRSLIA